MMIRLDDLSGWWISESDEEEKMRAVLSLSKSV